MTPIVLRQETDGTVDSLSRDLLPEERALVLAHVVHGDRERVDGAVESLHWLRLAEERAQHIPVPEDLELPLVSAWRAAVAEAVASIALADRGIERWLPALFTQWEEESIRAAAELPDASERVSAAQRAAASLAVRADVHFSRKARAKDLARRASRLAWRTGLLWATEAATIFAASASWLGVLEYPLDAIPVDILVQAFALTLPTLITLVALLHGVDRLMRAAPGVGGRRALAAVAIALFAAVGGSVALLRFVGFEASTAITPQMESLVGGALFVVSSATTLVLALVIHAHHARLAAARRVETDARMAEAALARAEEANTRALTEATDRVRVLETARDLPGKRRVAFAGAVLVFSQRVAWELAYVQDRRLRCVCAWERLRALPAEVRDIIPELLREREAAERGDGTPPTWLMVLFAFVIGGMPVVESGCAGPSVPVTDIVLCDGSGPSQEDVCSTPFLQGLGHSWARAARPGDRIQVVTTADRFGAIVAHEAVTAPQRWEGNARVARARWVREVVSTVGAIDVPVDTPEDRAVNKSDLLGGIAVAAREARNVRGHRVRLLIASDLWVITPGIVNAEREVPTATALHEALRAHGVDLDLSVLQEVTICGAHNIGAELRNADARDALFEDLVPLLGGPEVRLLTSCRGLYPPVPVNLLTVAAGEEGP